VLLLGGARSGKSTLALQLATRGQEPVVFLATGRAGDEEMAARIERHRRERPAAWETLEEPLRLRETIARVPPTSCLVVDCLTLWVSNLLERGEDAIESRSDRAVVLARRRASPAIVVSNEVGLGVVPVSELGRRYRDVLGRVNAQWAAAADEAALVVAGRMLWLH
jgi:adenosylcobinamide kinase/adenosylcobinamide-phosphate guanylyltransferase